MLTDRKRMVIILCVSHIKYHTIHVPKGSIYDIKYIQEYKFKMTELPFIIKIINTNK